jgi:CRISPR-associated protein Cst2
MRELDARDAEVFLGDDRATDGMSVHDAYEAALDALASLYDPTGGAAPVPFESFAETADASA